MKMELSFWLSLLVFTVAIGGTFATDPVLGSSCSDPANCSSVANSVCDETSKCACDVGYKESDSNCDPKALNDVCPRGNPDCNHLEGATCRPSHDFPTIMKCLCEVKSKYDPIHDRCENRDIQVRLANGDQAYTGRVEIRYQNMWGTVTSSNFLESEAKVFCTAMGMRKCWVDPLGEGLENETLKIKTNGGVVKGSKYGPGYKNHTIWLKEITCVGTEDSPEDCKHGTFGECTDCDHEKDVSIECDSITTQDMYRLANGSTPYYGRIEFFWDGKWGTVCNDGFSLVDTEVFCRTLGLTGGIIVDQGAGGTGTIWLDKVDCKEHDRYLHHCEHNPYGVHNCDHTEDVWVECESRFRQTESRGNTRLKGGKSELEGRLEVWQNGAWGPVCVKHNEDFNNEAKVVCSSLGFKGGKPYRAHNYGATGGTIKMGDVDCNGSEDKIQDCPHKDFHELPSHCSSLENRVEIAIACEHSAYSIAEFRLADGPKDSEDFRGRVELGIDGEWGTVCATGWDDKSVSALCKLLGQSDGNIVRTPNYGLGSGLVWETAKNCKGEDSNKLECGWKISSCKHEDELNVQCLPERPAKVEYRLMDLISNTPSKSHGRLEVLYDGKWGQICAENLDNAAAAKVACRSLGLDVSKSTKLSRNFLGPRLIWMAGIKCEGSEEALHKCPFAGWGRTAGYCATTAYLVCYW